LITTTCPACDGRMLKGVGSSCGNQRSDAAIAAARCASGSTEETLAVDVIVIMPDAPPPGS
jgi:hypothetical protein